MSYYITGKKANFGQNMTFGNFFPRIQPQTLAPDYFRRQEPTSPV